jgi:hypothetical protein
MSTATFSTWTTENYNADADTLSTDAENIMRRAYDLGATPALDLFTGIDGRVYVRFDG